MFSTIEHQIALSIGKLGKIMSYLIQLDVQLLPSSCIYYLYVWDVTATVLNMQALKAYVCTHASYV